MVVPIFLPLTFRELSLLLDVAVCFRSSAANLPAESSLFVQSFYEKCLLFNFIKKNTLTQYCQFKTQGRMPLSLSLSLVLE